MSDLKSRKIEQINESDDIKESNSNQTRPKSYIIIQGEKHEGGSVQEVCETQEEAEKWVELYINKYKLKKWTKNGEIWESGCDYISIEEWEPIKKAEDSKMFKH